MTEDPDLRARFRGCLLGGAVGDALGAPVEFFSRKQIQEAFGISGIRDFAPAYGGVGTITDDTQMTLFTAEGLIRSQLKNQLNPPADPVTEVGRAYQRWLRTQQAPVDQTVGPTRREGLLLAEPCLYERRAPGSTCLAALAVMESPQEPAFNDSKGCGGVMRVAPVGLFFHGRLGTDSYERTVLDEGAAMAGLTHGHPAGQLAAGTLAAIIHGISRGADLQRAIEAACQDLVEQPGHHETLNAITRALKLTQQDVPADEAIKALGQGWVAEQALAVALYACLSAHDFEDAVCMAVNHDGDSDSTGAITGQIMGALQGVDAIPRRWLRAVELRELITELADDLLEFRDGQMVQIEGSGKAFLEQVQARYPVR